MTLVFFAVLFWIAGWTLNAVLANGPYQPQPEFDAAMVTRAAREWIRRHG